MIPVTMVILLAGKPPSSAGNRGEAPGGECAGGEGSDGEKRGQALHDRLPVVASVVAGCGGGNDRAIAMLSPEQRVNCS
jgi:hypothetical protein